MMHSLPEIPNHMLIQDYLKGKRNQIFLDDNGVHQYEKRLDQIKQMHIKSKSLAKDYYYKNPHGSKINQYVNHFLLKEFGKVLETGSLYCEYEDKYAFTTT
jgi:hypothetical protein